MLLETEMMNYIESQNQCAQHYSRVKGLLHHENQTLEDLHFNSRYNLIDF